MPRRIVYSQCSLVSSHLTPFRLAQLLGEILERFFDAIATVFANYEAHSVLLIKPLYLALSYQNPLAVLLRHVDKVAHDDVEVGWKAIGCYGPSLLRSHTSP